MERAVIYCLHSTSEREKEGTMEQSIEEAYLRHVDMLYRVCFSYMKNAADTEDVVSETFVKLIRHEPGFQDAEHEKAWLLRVAINLCKDNLKSWWRNRKDIDDHIYLEGENPFIEDETLKIVLGLPERYKVVIYLYYYEGYSSSEIAGILKKPRSTILYHLYMARKLMKEVLENEE